MQVRLSAGGRCSPGGAGEGAVPGGAGGPGALRHRGRAGPGVRASPAAHADGPGRVLPLPAAGLGSVRLRRAWAAGDTERGRAGASPAPSARGGLAGPGPPCLGCGGAAPARGWAEGGGDPKAVAAAACCSREKARVNRAAFVSSILALLPLLRGAYLRVASVYLAKCKRMTATVVNSVVLT